MKYLTLLGIPLTLLVATACLGPKTYGPDEDPQGAAIYAGSNCKLCHGSDLLGTALGPSLADAEENWTVATLAQYFETPAEVIDTNIRLKMVAQEYDTDMPAYDSLLAKHREVLAAWVIEQAQDL